MQDSIAISAIGGERACRCGGDRRGLFEGRGGIVIRVWIDGYRGAALDSLGVAVDSMMNLL